MKRLSVILLSVAAYCGSATGQQMPASTEYFGICDASTAMPLGGGLFVVASDEQNALHVYRRGEAKAAQDPLPLTTFLKPDPDEPETDLEGAARIGDLIYWTTSHAQNKNGKDRSSRHRLFATTLAVQNGKVTVTPVGAPYVDLRRDLIAAPQLAKYKLEAAAKLAPEKEHGFNIEGLAATPDDRLLLAFRNPITDGKALIVPIENPREVIEGKKARIGAPIELSLKSRGIRSIEYSRERQAYLVVAGPFNDGGPFALYTWSGKPGTDAEIVEGVDFGTLNPEAMYVEPGDKTGVHVISDDGGRPIGGKDCKDNELKDQRFRGTYLTTK